MRTHVTFEADFARDGSPAEPAGRDLARHLAACLQAAGFAAGPPAVHEGYAYTFECRRDRQTLAVFVALVDDGILQGLAYAEPKVGEVTRWLRKAGIGRSRAAASPLLPDLCAAIHQCLRADPRFRSIRWYTTEGWDTNPDADWSRAP